MGEITTRYARRPLPPVTIVGEKGPAGEAGAAGAAGTSFAYTAIELADGAAVTPNSAYLLNWTANTGSGGFTVNAPTGTPQDGQRFTLRVKATNARAITWNAAFRGSTDTPLPTTLAGGGKTERHGFEWNAADSKWDYVAFNVGH